MNSQNNSKPLSTSYNMITADNLCMFLYNNLLYFIHNFYAAVMVTEVLPPFNFTLICQNIDKS